MQSARSSLTLATKLMFSSIGVAILTTILVDRTESRATALATQLQALAQSSGAAPGGLADPALQAQIATQAGTWAIQGIFWLIFFGSFGLLVLALALPGRRRHRAAAHAESELVAVGS